MEYAILSDIHGNEEALYSVLEECFKRNIHAYIFLGDLVDYGAGSNEVLTEVRKLGFQTKFIVCGNHDAAVVDDKQLVRFKRKYGKDSLLITRRELSEGNLEFLKNEIVSVNDGRVITPFGEFYHGSFNDQLWGNLYSDCEDSMINFDCYGKTMIVGHTHLQMKFVRNGVTVINPGSVGQPRNGDNRAQFCIYNLDNDEFSFHRVNYNVDKAASKIKLSGRDEFLAARLKIGV
jgi:predicted phosphodiesterase